MTVVTRPARHASENGTIKAVTYEDAVSYMGGLLQWGVRLDRARFVELLRRLDNPHEKWQAVHVAGTNGKGSTTALIASVLYHAGYKVGAYLSPYVFDVRERILLNGQMIGKDDFARWVSFIRPHIEAVARETDLGQTTEFELKTAVAFCFFAEQKVDFAVVEVGIGGRLDATNVIPPPLVSVITSIGWDHVPLLGNTLAEIAGEKAGIIKRGTLACITGVPQTSEAIAPIMRRAYGEGVPLLRVAVAAPENISRADSLLFVRDAGTALVRGESLPGGAIRLHAPAALQAFGLPPLALNLRLALRGPFQAANAGAALAAVSILQKHGKAAISPEALQAGLENAALPARFQIVRKGGKTLVLDVAHNADGAHVLADALQAEFGDNYGNLPPFSLVVGMSRSHDPQPFLQILAPLFENVVVTTPKFRPKPTGETHDAALRAGLVPEVLSVVEPVADAVRQAWEAAPPGGVVVVTGSFYTVGETPADLM